MAIMKKYVQGELPENMYGNEASKQGDSKTNVVKGASAKKFLQNINILSFKK